MGHMGQPFPLFRSRAGLASGEHFYPDDDFLDAPEIDEQKQPTVDREEMEAILRESLEPYLTLYSLLAGCGPMRPGEALGLDIRAIHPDFRTLDIVQKAKRGELQDYMKTKNADSKHGRVVDLPVALATLLREFVGARRSGLVFCKHDGSQLMQRDILKYSLHPILKKLALEQRGATFFGAFALPRWRQLRFRKRYSTPGLDTPELTCPRFTKSF
jgi:integrase